MPKSHTKMMAGRLVAAYVEDGMGRRLVVAEPDEYTTAFGKTLVFAHTQSEAKAAIATLRQLLEELPP
jgi:type I site-specific restriction endonuclease